MILMQKDAFKFKLDAKLYTERVTVSKQKAQDTLIKLGIYTKEGKLTDNYK